MRGSASPRPHRGLAALALAAVVALAACGPPPPISNPGLNPQPASHDWTQFGFDAARSGDNTAETTLTTTTAPNLTKLWQVRLPGVADSSPILLHGMPFPNGARDVLYVTTRDGRLLALDASDGALIWQKQPSGPKITHSSPVADPSRKYVYAYGLDGSAHRYDAITGQETTSGGWPARITLMTQTEKESSALNIASGRLYVTTSGYIGDAPPYQGHIVTIDLQTGGERVFNSLCSNLTRLLTASDCSSEQSGIWARGGATVDPISGDIYAATGNGPYDADQGGADYGDSILKLSPDGAQLLDSFTPEDHQRLNEQDLDLGSMAPTPLPRAADSATPLMLIQGGKDGNLRLLNRENLSGQGGPGHVGGALQTIQTGCGFYSQPAVWTDPASHQPWVAVSNTCGLTVYRLMTGADGVSRLEQVWRDTEARTTSPVVANGVLYGAESGALRAWNAATGRRLWGSDQGGAGGSIGGIHWESPIVVGGALYISDENAALTCYGLKA
ncbi:MAG TPA: PQQ-binding-like beta-propeller repeat protein [Ktedonobacterales bacterium]|nr:PQQ-binding-like beta-propeller repeat protein [Ktedonobacterales bacterium]